MLVPNNPIPTINMDRVNKFIKPKDNDENFKKKFNKDNDIKWHDFRDAIRYRFKLNISKSIDTSNPHSVAALFDEEDPFRVSSRS